MLFVDFRYQICMHRRSNSELLSFDPKIERTLFRLKKIKVDNTEMEDQNIHRFNEGQSDENETLGIREPTLDDSWRPMMNEEYSRIQHQPIDANNFELKPALISMVQQQEFGGSPSKDPNGHLSDFLQFVWHYRDKWSGPQCD